MRLAQLLVLLICFVVYYCDGLRCIICVGDLLFYCLVVCYVVVFTDFVILVAACLCGGFADYWF